MWLAAIGLTLMLLELGLRLIVGLGNPVLLQQDTVCGYMLKPNQHIYRFFMRTNTNQYGMRSAAVTPKKMSPESLRIMFLGDSITYGTTQVDQAEIFTELVRRSLVASTRRQVEVLNASAGAWAISNELAYVKSRGLFDSDVLVVVINRGDLSQPFSTVQEVGGQVYFEKPLFALGELLKRGLNALRSGVTPKVDAGIYVDSISPQVVQYNLKQLDEIHQLTSVHKVKLLVVYLPLRRDLKDGQAASLPSVLAEWAERSTVKILDLTSAETSVPGDQLVTTDHAHFNALGNKLIAKPLSDYIARNVEGS